MKYIAFEFYKNNIRAIYSSSELSPAESANVPCPPRKKSRLELYEEFLNTTKENDEVNDEEIQNTP